MKKIIAILLALLLVCSLASCKAKGADSESESEYYRIKAAVDNQIMVHIYLEYGTTRIGRITCFVDERGNNTFAVSGKVSVTDNYGDSYTGKYDAVVKYDPTKDSYSVSSIEIGKLYKN